MGQALRVLVAPDKFAGTLTAAEAGEAMAAGWTSVRPGDSVVVVPLADGGPGFVAALHASVTPVVTRRIPVSDPLGRRTEATLLVAAGTTYVETAQACGLHLLAPEDRDPVRASTAGVADLLRAALRQSESATGAGARIVLGLGGSATVDGGLGFLTAMGFVARDRRGSAVGPGAAGLVEVVGVDPPTAWQARFARVDLVAATDVTSPLTGPAGAVRAFGAQKGLLAACVEEVDDAMARWAEILIRDLGARPDLATCEGGGAAGGLGAALIGLGARRVSGLEVVATAVALERHIREADVVITGEGRFDATSLRGKVPGEVIAMARSCSRPVYVIAGDCTDEPGEGAGSRPAVRTLTGAAGSVAAARDRAGLWTRRVAAMLAAEVV